MLKWLKSLFQKDDPTAYNCEVYIHLRTSELIVVNSNCKIECAEHIKYHMMYKKPEGDEEFEYLGQL